MLSKFSFLSELFRIKDISLIELCILHCIGSIVFPDPKAETRLYVTVNGFEFHVYNRTDLYTRLQEIFGLEPTLIQPNRDEEKGREQRDKSLER